jgi:hypothetical protein
LSTRDHAAAARLSPLHPEVFSNEASRPGPIRVAVPAPGGAGAVRSVAIVQSSYIPWKGYFDLIHSVDEFILLDTVQYTRRDWRNRNLIKTPHGPQWLSIPVATKGRYEALIQDITVTDPRWAERHWTRVAASYRAAPHFRDYREPIEALYREVAAEPYLSRINLRLLEGICGLLGIRTRLSWSTDPPHLVERTPPGSPEEGRTRKTRRIVALCKQAGATRYLSGPSAHAYLDPELFREEGLELAYFDYAGYPPYPQLFPPFEHGVSILDLLFSEGPAAPRYMLSF